MFSLPDPAEVKARQNAAYSAYTALRRNAHEWIKIAACNMAICADKARDGAQVVETMTAYDEAVAAYLQALDCWDAAEGLVPVVTHLTETADDETDLIFELHLEEKAESEVFKSLQLAYQYNNSIYVQAVPEGGAVGAHLIPPEVDNDDAD